MIYKQDYYQGVAVLQVIGDPRYVGIRKHEWGFIVNGNIFFLVKYTTRPRSPWRFTFTQDELNRAASLIGSYQRLVVAFVCGGDGICALGWDQIENLMGFDPGWIAVKREMVPAWANHRGPARGNLFRRAELSLGSAL